MNVTKHLSLCPPQYYEMSYGLNIEMHKQVDVLICFPCSFLLDSLPLSVFALPLLRQGF